LTILLLLLLLLLLPLPMMHDDVGAVFDVSVRLRCGVRCIARRQLFCRVGMIVRFLYFSIIRRSDNRSAFVTVFTVAIVLILHDDGPSSDVPFLDVTVTSIKFINFTVIVMVVAAAASAATGPS
jgi:hypothetical protein